MKVLHIINSFDIGGAEKLLYNYILETNNSDCNYVAILKESDSFLHKKLASSGIEFIYLYEKNPIIKLFNLIKVVKNEKYDLIHAHLFPSSYYTSVASIFCKNTKFVFTEHSVTNRRRKYKIFRFIDRLIYKQFNGIIACSEEVKKSLSNWIGKNIDINIINNGVNEIEKINTTIEYDLILIGSLRSDVKGVDILLEELNCIKDQFNNAIIIGDGIEKAQLLELRDALGLDKQIEFLGIRDDIDILLSKSKIFVMPSRNEGFPLALLEAMSAKKPIVASDVAEIPKIIKHNETGLLINIRNKRELSEAIVRLLRDEDMCYKLGANAYKKYKKNYSIKKYCINVNQFYEKIIGEQK